MKKRPILFSTPMVQAILEGRKSQTRRTTGLECVNTPFEFLGTVTDGPNEFKLCAVEDVSEDNGPYKFGALFQSVRNSKNVEFIKCPYGTPGDRLWVRETWSNIHDNIIYKADFGDVGRAVWNGYDMPWRPSIHMPKAAARIWLEVEEVRVQRLQDIGHQDAVDEGILREWDGTKYWYQDYTKGAQGMVTVSQLSYKSLWESINGPESWEQNPFVWVIKFKRV